MPGIQVFGSGASLGAESVETTNIKNLAVTSAKIGTEAVGTGKVQPSSKPTPGAEESVTLSFAGVPKVIQCVIVGNEVQTKYQVPHALGGQLVGITCWKEKGTSGSEPTVIGNLLVPGGAEKVIKEIKVVSNTVIEVIFETALPKKKEAVWLVLYSI